MGSIQCQQFRSQRTQATQREHGQILRQNIRAAKIRRRKMQACILLRTAKPRREGVQCNPSSQQEKNTQSAGICCT